MSVHTPRGRYRGSPGVLAVLGAALTLVGDLTPRAVGLSGLMGLLMGPSGCPLGTRVLGPAAVVLAPVEIAFGVATG